MLMLDQTTCRFTESFKSGDQDFCSPGVRSRDTDEEIGNQYKAIIHAKHDCSQSSIAMDQVVAE